MFRDIFVVRNRKWGCYWHPVHRHQRFGQISYRVKGSFQRSIRCLLMLIILMWKNFVLRCFGILQSRDGEKEDEAIIYGKNLQVFLRNGMPQCLSSYLDLEPSHSPQEEMEATKKRSI